LTTLRSRSSSFFFGNTTGSEYVLSIIVCAFTLLFYYRSHLFDVRIHYTLDQLDGLIQASILEHWYGVLGGRYHWRDPIFFYPYKRVLGYNDAYFLYGLLYSAFRTLGVDVLNAMELTTAVVRAVGFFATWLLLRHYFRLSIPATAFGAVLVTVTNGVYLGTMHTQLATVAFLPLMFCLVARAYELLVEDRMPAAAVVTAAIGLLLSTWSITGFYAFWFTLFFVLITTVIAFLLDRRTFIGVVRDVLTNRRWIALTPGVLIFLVGLIPLALIYGEAARTTGMHAIGETYNYLPRIVDLINVGPANVVWSGVTMWLRKAIVHDPTGDLELWVGFTPIELALLVVAAVAAFWRAPDASPREVLIYRSLLVAIFVGMALQVQVHGATLWTYVYSAVPGARALRVVARFQLVLLTVGAALAAVALDRLGRSRRPLGAALALSLAALILVGQWDAFRIANFTRADVAAFRNIPAPPKECREFYTVAPLVRAEYSETSIRWYIHSVEAMMLATMTGLPTVLGMDTFTPPDWNLDGPYTADYEPRVYAYAKRNQLLPGLCALNLTTLKWSLIDAPPRSKNTPDPLGLGLKEGDLVGLAAGQPATAMLTDGWSGPEDWGVWAIGTESRLDLRLNGAGFTKSGAVLRLAAWAFLPPGVGSKNVEIFVGDSARGEPIAQWTLGPHGETKVLCIPPSAVAAGRLLTLFFKTNRSYSPSGATGTGDARRLDFAARWLSVSEGPCLPPSP
jgi:hypothetical protein